MANCRTDMQIAVVPAYAAISSKSARTVCAVCVFCARDLGMFHFFLIFAAIDPFVSCNQLSVTGSLVCYGMVVIL